MTGPRLDRIGGTALFLGAVAFIVHLVARSLITASLDPVGFSTHSVWVPINALGALGAALVLLGLPAIYSRLVASNGLVGVVGIVLISAAWMFFGVFLSLYATLVSPWLAANAPSLLTPGAPPPAGVAIAFILALLAELLGSILLGIPFVRGHLQPRWVGYALPGAAVLTVVGSLIAPSGPASNLAVNLVSNAGPVLFMATLAYLGSQSHTTKDGPAA